VGDIKRRIEKALHPDGLFIASQVRVPDVFLWNISRSDDDDHCFHEFFAVEETQEEPDDVHGRTIDEFLITLQAESVKGWRCFFVS
jgi:hypothetical protein